MAYDFVALWVDSDDRHVTRIAAMEHLDQFGIPVIVKAMVAVKLQLISLAFVMTLDHLSSVEDVFGVLMPDILHDDSRCIWLLLHFFDIVIDVIKHLEIPLVP